MSFAIDPRWRWHFEPDAEAALAYLIRPPQADARGTLEIWMPGATAEQFHTLRTQLIAKFTPAFEVPATRFVDIEAKRGRGI